MYNWYFNTWPKLTGDLVIMIGKNLIFVIFYIFAFFVFAYLIYSLTIYISNKLAVKYLRKDLIAKIKLTKLEKISKLGGKQLVKEFIKYLETFNTSKQYNNIKEILEQAWLENNEIQDILNIVYKDYEITENIETSIKSKINLFIEKLKW